jgi:hypothetical protein
MMAEGEEQKFRSVGRYPFKEPVLLKGLFLQSEVLIVRLVECVEAPKAKGKA